jgi:branched-chain amino acid transport system ATP-binding protein
MTPVLEIQGLSKQFGGVKAIANFTLQIQEHEINGLIGPNGAGKTTIFNTVTGIYQPTSGTINFDGHLINGLKPFRIAQLGIGRTFQNIRLFGKLSVLDNVFIACQKDATYGFFGALTRLGSFHQTEKRLREKAMELLKLVGLENYAQAVAGSLPYGHQRKLEIARALALNPKLILLDEPAAGMNSEESMELVDFIFDLHEKFHLTIFMIEHHMDVVMKLCQVITVLNFGETIAHGTSTDVRTNPAVIEAYLGRED